MGLLPVVRHIERCPEIDVRLLRPDKFPLDGRRIGRRKMTDGDDGGLLEGGKRLEEIPLRLFPAQVTAEDDGEVVQADMGADLIDQILRIHHPDTLQRPVDRLRQPGAGKEQTRQPDRRPIVVVALLLGQLPERPRLHRLERLRRKVGISQQFGQHPCSVPEILLECAQLNHHRLPPCMGIQAYRPRFQTLGKDRRACLARSFPEQPRRHTRLPRIEIAQSPAVLKHQLQRDNRQIPLLLENHGNFDTVKVEYGLDS